MMTKHHSHQSLWMLLLAAFFVMPSITKADPITLSKAKLLATSFMRSAAEPQLVTPNSANKVRRRIINGQPTQSYYVFSRGAGEGFVIVSGNDALPEIIGYTDKGDFDYDNMPPALQDMLTCYAAAADSISDMPTAQQPKRVARKATGTHDIATLMTTHWHQSWPYNNLCPHLTTTGSTAVTGCVATASSQIIYYWRKECNQRSQYVTPTYDYGAAPATAEYQIPKNTPFKWDLMKDSYSSSDNAERQEAVATLMACVGMSGYLMYGSSTSGELPKICAVFSGQFGLNAGTYVKKADYSQTNWEKMIISDLEAGRPILYSGVHPKNGGHAVVIDGYQLKTNKFHFNFGWGAGNGYDGYYTVDDVTGMNGFYQDQAMVYQVYPKKVNVNTEVVSMPETLQARYNNLVRYRITNNGTLPLSGFYFYCSTGTSLSTVSDKDETTIIQPGESADLTFTCTPSSASKYYLTLANANKNKFVQSQVQAQAALCDLTLCGMSIVDGGVDVQETVAGQQVSVKQIYNDAKLNISATLTNGASATDCLPSISSQYDTYDESTGTFTGQQSKTKSKVEFQSGSQSDVVFDLTGLKSNVLYRFRLASTASVGKSYPIAYATSDTVLYFRMMGAADMNGERSADGKTMTVTGHYNAQAFSKLNTDSTVCNYDMKQVLGLNSELSAANRNALFYADASQQVAGRNIVTDGVCAELDLTPGYDFAPAEAFKAMRAVYHAAVDGGKYLTAFLPFTAHVPSGIYAQQIDQVTSSVSTHNVSTLQAGVPYVILSGRATDITAESVDVSAEASAQCINEFKGTFCNQTATSAEFMLDDQNPQYFSAAVGAVIPALTAYTSKKVRVCSSDNLSLCKKSRALAEEIALAQSVLYYESICTTTEAQLLLQKAIANAEDTLTLQPEIDAQTQARNSLAAALAAFQLSHYDRNSKGYPILTALITNPSFEQGTAVTGWKRSKTTDAAVQKLNTSTNFMGGIDGDYFVKLQNAASIEQTVENVPNGIYQLVVSTALDYDKTATFIAGDKKTQIEATDFGPYIFQDVTIDNINVTDHTLTMKATAGDDWMKIDNIRLYQKECTDVPSGIEVTTPSLTPCMMLRQGVYDLTGRKLSPSSARHGIFIIDGRKVVR